ncbi:MAG: hypothetical protein KME11_20880 [Timaviella obliquedivisa GSE-PSE-MK23-08B]|jgi:hypothetical protein|nr:hypothetical protein [Timaviella obliquedivisa GSE-PSE-MK23-08B]
MKETSQYLSTITDSKQTLLKSSYLSKKDAIALMPGQTRGLGGIATVRSSNALEASKARAISTESFIFNNFNQPAIAAQSDTVTNSVVFSETGKVLAVAIADAFFGLNPITNKDIGLSSVTAEVISEGTSFKGVAEGFATVAGAFFVPAGETFSFNFSGFLQMNTSLQNADTQAANTLGRIAFGVYDVTRKPVRLDFLEVTGGLDTPGHRDFLNFQISNSKKCSNISLDWQQTGFTLQTGKLEESALVSVVGEYKTQPFTQDTLLVVGDFSNGLKQSSELSGHPKYRLNQNHSAFKPQKERSHMGTSQPSKRKMCSNSAA